MKKENQDNKQKWLKSFVNKNKYFDYESFGRMMDSSMDDCVFREEFERLRGLSELQADKVKMWEEIKHRTDKNPRYHIIHCLKYVAVLTVFIFGGVLWWMLRLDSEDMISAELAKVEKTLEENTKAYILFPEGKRIDLATIGRDTTIVDNGMKIRIDSLGKISYAEMDVVGMHTGDALYNTIVVPRGEKYQLELADGSLVWLNSDSELRYPIEFVGQQRKVWLKGEGFFEIRKNLEKPFQVMVDDMVVNVLGTSFNINAYCDEGSIETTLISGKVDIQDVSGKSLVMMEPNQQVDFLDGKILVKRDIDATKYIAWINDEFYFDEMTLEGIMLQLQRWYDIEVFFSDSKLKTHTFTGVIRRDFTIEQVFEIIEKTAQVRFCIKNNHITVLRR